MRSIWENIVRWLVEAEDDPDKPGDWQGLSIASKRAAKARLTRARDAVVAKGHTGGSDQARRDKQARVMQDPHAARVLAQPPSPEDWEDEIPGGARVQGTPAVGDDDLPKPVQAAPGTSAAIGAGRIAAKNAEPTSVSLGARARQVDPGVSGIKARYNVAPDAFFGDAPVKVDPNTGKKYPLIGRPQKGQPGKDELEIQREPFAAQHAAAVAKNTAKKPPDKSKISTYSAGAFAPGGGAHKPKGGEVRMQGGNARVTPGDERAGTFLGQGFNPAGHTAPSDDEWAAAEALPPEQRTHALAMLARRLGGKGGSRLSYGRTDVGQRGRMTVPASPGKGAGTTFNPYTGEWETPEQMGQSLQRPDIRAQVAAKLALRGADISNKRFGAERRPHASRASAAPLGNVVPKDAATQSKDARAAAIASKPIPVNTRRDDEPKRMPGGEVPKYKPENPGVGGSAGSAGSSGEGPIDRGKMKQMIAQRMAAMAAKKASEKP